MLMSNKNTRKDMVSNADHTMECYMSIAGKLWKEKCQSWQMYPGPPLSQVVSLQTNIILQIQFRDLVGQQSTPLLSKHKDRQ